MDSGVYIVLGASLLGACLCLIAGFIGGLVAYHMVRHGVTKWMPIYKATDNSASKNKMMEKARQLQKEVSDMQHAYLSGLNIDREGYLKGK